MAGFTRFSSWAAIASSSIIGRWTFWAWSRLVWRLELMRSHHREWYGSASSFTVDGGTRGDRGEGQLRGELAEQHHQTAPAGGHAGHSSETLQQIISTRKRGQAPTLSEVMSGTDLSRLFDLTDRIHLPEAVANYIARLVTATHPQRADSPDEVKKFVKYGASPRAAIALASTSRAAALLADKPNVGFREVQKVAPCVLGHRLILDYSARLEGWTPVKMVDFLTSRVAEVAHQMPADVKA